MHRLFSTFCLALLLIAAVVSARPSIAQSTPATPRARTTRWTNLYDRPNGRPTAIALAPNSEVTIMSESAGWVEVQAAAGRGWLPANAITRGGATPATPAPSAAGLQTTRWVNLHATPGGAPTGRALAPATPLSLLETSADGNWLRVTTATGATGWLPRSATRDAATPPTATPRPTSVAPTTPRISGVELGSRTAREVEVIVRWEGVQPNVLPYVSVVADATCAGTACISGSNAAVYSTVDPDAVERLLRTNNTPRSGTTTVRVTIDNTRCASGQRYTSTRLTVELGDFRPTLNDLLTILRDPARAQRERGSNYQLVSHTPLASYTLPFAHTWCD